MELPLHSHYISGIKAKNQILDYISDVNKTFFVNTKTSIFFQDQDQDHDFLVKTKTFSFKTKIKTLPGPLNKLPYHGHKMNKTVYTRHA